VEYLAEKGMRKILYIRPEFRSRNEESMEAGFTAAIQKYQDVLAARSIRAKSVCLFILSKYLEGRFYKLGQTDKAAETELTCKN
ncbi:MAG: hypothetical protein IKM47_01170, partial [Bacteroidaceae bacterium]|nr:hypothetical protein [Bacteroidaceae bacterium]